MSEPSPSTRRHRPSRFPPESWLSSCTMTAGRRLLWRDRNALSDGAFVNVALHGHGVTAGRLPVCPKSALPHPPIIEILAIGVELGASTEDFAISTVVEVLAISGAIPEIEEALLIA